MHIIDTYRSNQSVLFLGVADMPSAAASFYPRCPSQCLGRDEFKQMMNPILTYPTSYKTDEQKWGGYIHSIPEKLAIDHLYILYSLHLDLQINLSPQAGFCHIGKLQIDLSRILSQRKRHLK